MSLISLFLVLIMRCGKLHTAVSTQEQRYEKES